MQNIIISGSFEKKFRGENQIFIAKLQLVGGMT